MIIRNRIIPILLLKKGYLYKGKKFKNHKYIGEPINAVRIFNEKEVDELVFFDISATDDNLPPNFSMLHDIASECFMPLSYGGGVVSLEIIRELIMIGIEKVIINTQAVRNPEFVKNAVNYFGSSSIVASIDAKKNVFGSYKVYINSGKEKTNLCPIEWAINLEKMGVGEIIINSIDRDGTFSGYDWDLVNSVVKSVNVPVVAAGGASSLIDLSSMCRQYNASAAAGSLFVFQGKHNAVLITYPSQDEISFLFND
jgi:cyclase